jgi:hypothetical protein
MSEPAIAVVPYGIWKPFGMGKLDLDTLSWPLGRPDRLRKGSISDLSPEDHLLVFANKKIFALPWFGIRAKLSVMIVEPDALHGKNLDRARRWHKSFFAILSKSESFLSTVPNGVFYYFGSTFIEDIEAVDPTKTRLASLIASAKDDLPGHQLRHRIVDHIQTQDLDVDIMGRGYKPFDNKADGLESYMFSVVIENVREKHYLTEKIVDAALCRTVPIYWGCPNIKDYFAVDGMIICETEEELRLSLNTLSADDYESRRDAIEENYQRALVHADHETRAAQLVQEQIKRF